MNALMPSTTTQDAADAMKYYPVWQTEFADGQTQLQFQDWLKQYLGQQPQSMVNSFRTV